jgi:hypothetical protein
MSFPEHPVLQNRWQLRRHDGAAYLVYYGLRNPPSHTRSVIELAPEIADSIGTIDGSQPGTAPAAEPATHPQFSELIRDGVVVDREHLRPDATPDNRQRCVRCVTDDYLLPGLEFDENGLCAFCQCYAQAEASGRSAGPRESITDEELQRIAADNTDSRFDVMVLCTGGKDSTFLLWYLAKKLKLRVLAASWNMPYTNDTCRDNLHRSIRLLPDVEFVERTLPWNLVRQAMHDQFAGIGLPCLCPMAAHALFYPMAFQEKIPLIMHGVEEVQLAIMSYVMSELKPGGSTQQSVPDYRAGTLGFLQTITAAQAPAHPFAINADMVRYMGSIRKVLAPIYGPLEEIIGQAQQEPSLPIPHLRRLQTNTSYGSWAEVAALIKKEMLWQMPPGQKGLLHTSCRIEKVKDYCQFKRFQAMRSTSFPQSVVELGAGVYFGLISREAALEELQELGYHREPEVLAPLLADLGIDGAQAVSLGEVPWSLGRCRACS